MDYLPQLFTQHFVHDLDYLIPQLQTSSNVCTHPINPVAIDLLCCVYGNESIRTHNVICDTFVAITRDASFHVGWEQLHVLPSTTFNSFRRWINIVFSKDGIHTLTELLLLTQHERIYFPSLTQFKDFSPLM